MSFPEFAYSVLLRPQPLRWAANMTLRAVIPASIQRHGAVIALNPADPVVSGALTLGVYEKTETKFFLSVCAPGMIFLDIGANSGYYTALFLSRSGRDACTVAFEPDPQCYEFLTRTVAANQGTRVTCLRTAASDTIGASLLYQNLENRGDNRLYANPLASSSCQVETSTVDASLDGLCITKVNLIKIDVQGCEAKVFRGMERTIRQSSQLIILSEFWPWGLAQSGDDAVRTLDSLTKAGLSIFHLSPKAKLLPIEDHVAFSRAYVGREYTNIVATKGVNVSRWAGEHA